MGQSRVAARCTTHPHCSLPLSHLVRCDPTLPTGVSVLEAGAQLSIGSQLYVQLPLDLPGLCSVRADGVSSPDVQG